MKLQSQQQQQEIRPQAIPPATLPVDMVEGTEVSSTATMPPKLLSDDSVAADQTDVEGAHAQVAEDVVTGPQPHAAEEQNLESKESAQMPDTVESTQVSQGVKEDVSLLLQIGDQCSGMVIAWLLLLFLEFQLHHIVSIASTS